MTGRDRPRYNSLIIDYIDMTGRDRPSYNSLIIDYIERGVVSFACACSVSNGCGYIS